jgi:uroporphyrinogen-III synthase
MTTRVLVTRAVDQAPALVARLRDLGIEPVLVPAVAIESEGPGGPLDGVAPLLHTFDWVVITSANGARAILAAAERVFTPLETPRWGAIGNATAEVLERAGIEIDFRPRRADERTLAAELPVDPGAEVLLIRGELAGVDLPHRLRERGARVTEVIAYRTVIGPTSSRSMLLEALDDGRPVAVLFASGSAVRGLLALAEGVDRGVTSIPAICIGPETAREAIRHGFEVLATASTPDPTALAAATVAALAPPLETR